MLYLFKFRNLFHTLRYLRLRQILYQVWFRIIPFGFVDQSPSPGRRESANGFFSPPSRRTASMLGREEFAFLNVSDSLLSVGWRGNAATDTVSMLWLYNLHYFDDLNALGCNERVHWHRDLLIRWVQENPPERCVGWDPYPTSLRIVNWVKWHFLGNPLPHACEQSLAVQARCLIQRIEWHIPGNHLFANAKALVFAGLFFSGREADYWLCKGLKIISEQLPEQVLSDGGNFERSPMYHSIFLEDLLDLINLSRMFPGTVSQAQASSWVGFVKRMLDWLDAMVHPDGEISFFNDAAIGVAPSPAELFNYARRLGIERPSSSFTRLTQLADSGYIRLASAQAVAFLDVAPVGPDFLPGHAHADTLSFEWSLFGQRVVTNGGTSRYGTGAIRQSERGTAAHSTVTVNGENSSEVWGGFRVARRAYPLDLAIDQNPACITIRCSHTGYRRLRSKPVHQRELEWTDSSLQVTDTVSDSAVHALARFHFHPDIEIVESKLGSWTLTLPCGQSVRIFVEHGTASLGESYYAPEFGKRILRACLEVELINQRSQVRFEWEPHH